MKKCLFIVVALFAVTSAFSQQQGKIRVGMDLGYTIPSDGGGGLLFSIEPKYNIADNMNVGLRWSSAAMVKGIKSLDSEAETIEAKISANSSYMGTFDYYFSSGASSFAPYVGAGIGYVALANVEFDTVSYEEDQNDGVAVDGKFGGLIRAGFEAGKFRMGLEYNIIPKSDLSAMDGTKIGEVANSYIGIHVGFYVGGGKWKK
jgi:outer membrane protein W